ncbi:MAG: hypothetical protein KF681_00920 [Bdellovibrionaceae bacterium]|nr:hypothetical protein [Pseudobdellovibrionaceae bacterium]
MKTIVMILISTLGLRAAAADKALFSVFKGPGLFAEATCHGLPGNPRTRTIRLPASGSDDYFETIMDLFDEKKIVVSASRGAGQYTLIVMMAEVSSQPIMAATYGLDAYLGIGSGVQIFCELNKGAQLTNSFASDAAIF